MEKRALACTKPSWATGNYSIKLCKDHNRRRTRRTGHELKPIIPASTLEVITSSSLNIAKKTWNNLLDDIP
uniref:Transposase n=1 Tax=Acrobeloides nanus TaxID=290746 RepID=A0A914C2G1_9BILA